MDEEMKKLSNKELIQIYRLIMEHLEYLETEKKKLEEEDSK